MTVQNRDDTADDTTLLTDTESKETTLLSDPSTIHLYTRPWCQEKNLGKKRPLFEVLKKSQDNTIGDSNKMPKSNNSHAINNTPIQPCGTKLRDPKAIRASKSSWQVSPPSDFYKDNLHPLALLWHKTPYISGHSYISVNDQKEVKQSVKTIWVPHWLCVRKHDIALFHWLF